MKRQIKAEKQVKCRVEKRVLPIFSPVDNSLQFGQSICLTPWVIDARLEQKENLWLLTLTGKGGGQVTITYFNEIVAKAAFRGFTEKLVERQNQSISKRANL